MMNLESVQLIKCLVENKDQDSSHRLIEKSNYDLWCFLMSEKHQIKILKSELCLWLCRNEFNLKEEIYQRAGEISKANKLLLRMYDNHGNFNNICRYTQEADSQAVKEILIKHLPKDIRQHNQFSLEIEEGFLVTTGPHIQMNLATEQNLSEVERF
jgi:hypothetical protein